jgi:cation:H+ antiporter
MFEYILLIAGLFLLLKGAGYLIEGASSLGKLIKIKPLIIGLTVLAFSTSLPELTINIFSSLEGTSDIGLGNIIGSNIANILLVLGAIAFFTLIKVRSIVVRRGIPFTLFSVAMFLLLANDSFFNGPNILSRIDGIILLIFFTIFIGYIYSIGKKGKKDIIPEALEPIKHSKLIISLMIFGGMIALFIGGKLVIDSSLVIARQLGLSEFLISATILAIGTSLPELMVSIVAATKKKLDFVVGNIIGSNIFNTFLILGVSSIIRPMPFSSIFNFDLLLLFIITAWLLAFMYIGKKHQLEKWNSFVFIGLYIFYIIYIINRG